MDKEEEYLHEMHLKGWKYRTSRFGFFYFDQCQPDDIIYCIYDSRFLKKHKHELQDFRNRGWELIGAGSCSILRKPAYDILSEDQVYMSKGLRWEVMRNRLRSCTATFLGWFGCLYEFVSRRTVATFLCHFYSICLSEFLI